MARRVSSPGIGQPRVFLAGWGIALLGGVLLVASSAAGGPLLAWMGVGAAIAGFGVAAWGFRSSSSPSAARSRSDGWLEDDADAEFYVTEPEAPLEPVEPPAPVPAPALDVPPVAVRSPPTRSPVPLGVAASSPPSAPPPPLAPPPAAPLPPAPAPPPVWLGVESSPSPADAPEPPPAAPAPDPASEPAVPERPVFELPPSLPFIPAAAGKSGGRRLGGGSLAESLSGIVPPSSEQIATEVDRLRVEYDGWSDPILVPGLSVVRPVDLAPSARGLVTRVPEPPAGFGSASGAGRCGSCGDPIRSGPSGHYRCWGCGREMCLSCFWKNGPGPDLHRCSACLAAAPTVPLSVSGGRIVPRSPTRPGVPDELE